MRNSLIFYPRSVEEIRFLSGLREDLGQDLPIRNIIIVKELVCFIPVVKSKCSLQSAEENSHILFFICRKQQSHLFLADSIYIN